METYAEIIYTNLKYNFEEIVEKLKDFWLISP